MSASPPGGNTKPVPDAVKAALAKAKDKVVREPQTPTVTTEHTYDPQQQAQARSAVARQIERKTGRPTGDPMPTDEARKLTDRIKFDAEQLWDKVIDAFLGRADVALGYASWDGYCTQEFPTSRLRLPREERSEVVPSLRDAGFSDRAIESATGISRRTLIRDRQRQSGGDIVTTSSGSDVDEDAVVDAEVVESKPVTGLDGKTYKPKQPKPQPKPKPRPKPDAAADSTDPAPSPDPADTDDVHTLWSPDATVAVTIDVDYCDLREWAISLYRHAADCTCHCRWDGDGDLRRIALWLSDRAVSDDCAEFDVFGATFLRLSPFVLIGEMATWLAAECDVDGVEAMKALIVAYQMWCYRLDEAFKEAREQESDGAQ